MKEFSSYEKGFIEAFLETDGCITIAFIKTKSARRKWVFRIKLEFANNSMLLLNKLREIIGVTGIINNHYKQCKKLVIKASDAKWILPQLTLTFKEPKKILALKIIHYIEKGSYKDEQYEKGMEELCHEVLSLRKKSKIFLTEAKSDKK